MQAFVEEIWKWYARHKRTLPWRDLKIKNDTERAYRILVSEIMLQQTQVSRVKVVYKNFIQTFPYIKDLAAASNKQIILAWRGMGYNSRALRLRDAAKVIVEEYDGKFPKEYEQLIQIKGIGPYTAGAIRNFAFNLPTPCIDTNIRRILHRAFVGPERSDGSWHKDDACLLKLAMSVLEIAINPKSEIRNPKCRDSDLGFRIWDFRRTTAEWHAALMDFGSLVCTKNNPKWDVCPLTAKGLMKAAYKVPKKTLKPKAKKQEPGRMVGSTYIPNRIFRGKLVEELRDSQKGMTIDQLGKNICIDWSPSEHREWLISLIEKLMKDQLIQQKGKHTFVIAE